MVAVAITLWASHGVNGSLLEGCSGLDDSEQVPGRHLILGSPFVTVVFTKDSNPGRCSEA